VYSDIQTTVALVYDMFYDQLTPSRPYRKSATSGRNALGHKTNKLINYYVGI